MNATRLLQALLLTFCALPSSGCFALWDADIEPLYEIEDDQWVVVKPFEDPSFPRSPWDSPTGHEAAMLTTEALRAMAPFNTVRYAEVLELMVAPIDEKSKKDSDSAGLDVRKLDNKKLSDLVAADYVLVCKILKFELKDPNNVNMTKGTAMVEASLFKVALTDDEIEEAEEKTERDLRRERAFKEAGIASLGPVGHGGRFVASGTITVHYPDDYLNQYGTPFLDPAVVREKLLSRIGHKVAELWYEHEPEKKLGTGS